MSKQITGAELAEVVTKLLANPDATVGQGDGKAYESLMTEIARAVCNHSGGGKGLRTLCYRASNSSWTLSALIPQCEYGAHEILR